MQKFFTRGIAILAMLFSFSLSAQTVVWPTADTNTIKASQFNGGLNGWTALGIKSTDATKNAAALWTWKANGKADRGAYSGGAAGATQIASPSVANGAMVFDSDYLDNGGTAGAFGAGPCPSRQIGALISPTINATGYSGLTVQFNAYHRNYDAAPYVAWSENGGVTWKDSVAISFYNRYLVVSGTDTATYDYPVTSGSANRPNDVFQIKLKGSVGTANFKIKIVWDGDYYNMILDDVKLLANGVDMQVNRNFYAIAPNFITPRNQVEPIRFMSDVSNKGARTATGVKLTSTIKALVGRAVVHTSTLNYPGSIKADSTAENVLSPNTYTPSNAANAIYFAKYSVASDSTDSYARNDSAQYVFRTSDSTFQKDNGASFASHPADRFWTNAPQGWKVGNGFYIVNGRTSTATAITANIDNADALRGKTVVASLYKVRPLTFDVNGDIPASSLVQVAAAEYTIPATAAAGATFRIPIYNILVSGNNKPAILEDTTTYLAMIEYIPASANTTTDPAMDIGLDDGFDYDAMMFATRLAGKPRLACVWTTIGGTDDAIINTRFDGLTPVVRLTVVPYRVDTKEVLADNNKMEVYPNPAKESITIDVDLVNRAEYLYVDIMDISGKTVLTQTFQNIKNDKVELSLANLANGSYMVKIVTQDGFKTKKIVVAK
jgi:Secretion system C-terminal sorting domain